MIKYSLSFLLGFIIYTHTMNRNLEEQIQDALHRAKTLTEAITLLKSLKEDVVLKDFITKHEQEFENYLARKFSVKPGVIERDLTTSYLGTLPKELRSELYKFQIGTIMKELLKPRSQAHRKSLINELKEYKQNLGLAFNDEFKEGLKPFFTDLITEGDIDFFNRTIESLNMENNLKHWKKLECDLLRAKNQKNIELVEKLIKEDKVDPETPFIVFPQIAKQCSVM